MTLSTAESLAVMAVWPVGALAFIGAIWLCCKALQLLFGWSDTES